MKNIAMEICPMKEILPDGTSIPWTEEDKIDWAEKARNGEFGDVWKEFVLEMQEYVNEFLLR